VTVGHRRLHPLQNEPGGRLHVLLAAGGTKPTALAGKSQEVFVLAVVAANAGEAAGQVAAVEELVNYFGDDGRSRP
jgi:hypothetical protein